ncbi:flagellar filament capping protein FliD [Timonella sp. A28]|uniref:flagellar filament capping protein FliD n=1 Tax=Timonella sp. A28 TaxID=3442640 RepID=UPI003EBD4DE0
MSMSIGGIASGLDTSTIINQLMQIEAIPKNQLQIKQKTTESFIAALQALNTKVASLTENAAKAAKPASYDAWAGVASSETVSVVTKTGASAGTIEFRVDALAQGKSSLSGVLADASTLLTGGVFTVADGEGNTRDITPASSSLTDLVSAINADKDLGVKATLINTPDGSRLQLTSTKTGATDGNFTITSGQAETGFSAIRSASDAQITLWPELGISGSTVTSATNTFTDLMAGVDITVTKVAVAGDDPIKVDINRDVEAVTKLADNLVAQLNQVISEVNSRSKVTTTTDSEGQQATTGGLFTGDSAARQLVARLVEAGSFPVDGKSPSEIGIEITRNGDFTFDAEKFQEALAADPAGTQDFVAAIATRVEAVGKATSDKYDGSLTLRVQSQQELVRDYGTQLESWDRRLEQRRQNLVQVYTALEVSLSRLQGQGNWLAGQLGSLPTASK